MSAFELALPACGSQEISMRRIKFLQDLGIVCVITALVYLCAQATTDNSSDSFSLSPSAALASPQEALPVPAVTPNLAVRPVIFNASQTAEAGDIVFIQGYGFGNKPDVILQANTNAPDQKLSIVNQVGDWLAVRLPRTLDPPSVLRVINAGISSEPIKLNAARGYHLDALQIVPGGVFRVFGRNLQVHGGIASVFVDGKVANIQPAESNDYMLTVVAPANLQPIPDAVITVDNGNGTGQSPVEQRAKIFTNVSGSPFGGEVGWTAAFTALMHNTLNINCENNHTDSVRIQNALNSLAMSGGGVAQLSSGICFLDTTLRLGSNLVLQGESQSTTILRYTKNYPISAENASRLAIRDLTLTNSGSAEEGPSIKNSQMVVLQNVTMNFGTERQSFFNNNRDIWVSGCVFNQKGSIDRQSPYLFSGSRGLIFQHNSTDFVMGASAFERISDAYVADNVFRRNGSAQNEPGTLHMMTVDFASYVAITRNLFEVLNGPITNTKRNDGEAILTEGGGGNRTENRGTVFSATDITLFDPKLDLNSDPFSSGVMPENYGVAIVGGKGAGQTRYVRGYSNGTLTVERPWDVVPDNSSTYATFVWGLEKSIIANNTFSQMPRGIWLYQTAIRDVDIVGNNFTDGGGIYLRSYQNLDSKMFDPVYDVRIVDNSVSNTSHNWLSYLSAVFVNSDARSFGIGMLGIEFRHNSVTTNSPNLSSSSEEYAGTEGYLNMMRVEKYDHYAPMEVPRVLGTIFQDNSCTNCDVDYRIGTGAGGTVISGAISINHRQLLDNWKTTSSNELATDTIILTGLPQKRLLF
jgi:hypothetical protein